MVRARSVAIVLSAGALTGAATAYGQGSGGEGAKAPIGHASSSKSSSGGSGSRAGARGPGLSQHPNLGGDTGSSSRAPGTKRKTPTAPGTALPNTGSDPGETILAGLALLLSGLGLRLRTADEIF